MSTQYTDANVVAWLKNEYLPLREVSSKPISDLNDPRAKALLEDPGHDGVPSGLGYNYPYITDLIQNHPEEAAELYFLRYVEKPEPPLPMPAWAEHKEVLWGEYPEIGVLYTSRIGQAGTLFAYFTQMQSIQILDDETGEPLDEAIIQEGPVEFNISDGRNGLLIPGDISVVEQFAAAVDDVARHFWKSLPRELKRHTEAGEPDFAGIGGGL